VIAANDRQFRVLTTVLGKPELADRPEFLHNEDRTRNRELLRRELIELLSAKGAAEWFRVLTEADLPCAPILGVDQGIAMAEELGMAPTVPVPSTNPRLAMVRNPLRFSRSTPRYELAPPGLDEDGEAVRAWLASD
jgi:crotonobetainyl-CoA:carnitine CoA-transferase CaiB-like acyl-CoA transferase